MPTVHPPRGVGGCPGPDLLLAYGAGKLGREEVETIGAHVEECAACQLALGEIAPERDSLASLLHDCVHAEQTPAPGEAPTVFTRTAIGPQRPDQIKTVTRYSTAPARGDDLAIAGQRLGSLLGPYRLLELMGQGGMGVVYRARDEALGRTVALKLVRLSAGPAVRERFRVEAESVARLDHPNIVRVYAFGEQDGEPYLAMEYLGGGSLTQRQSGQPLPAREAAELIQSLAAAVAYSHDRQVLHRDLKPDNVLYAEDGTAKLTDFGLAKLLDADEGQTPTDGIMGTLSYIAPELARGNAKTADATADVYGLGAVLYEMLTGRPPFKGGTRLATLDLVCNREPTPPSRYHPGLCRDLEAVCLKCLEKQPGDRYPSASALADDLGRWQRGEPTVARPLGRLARLGRSMRRHKTAVAAVLLGFLTCGAAAAALYPNWPILQYESNLRLRKEVKLIGETGPPDWIQWQLGGDKVQTSLSDDGTFAVHAWRRAALLELLRNPQWPRYRLRAKVRHDECAQAGRVGLYCRHANWAAGGVEVHTYCGLAFDDILDEQDLFRNLPPNIRATAAPVQGNQLCILPRVSIRSGPTILADAYSNLHSPP